MTILNRVVALLESGHGFSPEVIAAMTGISESELFHWMADPTRSITEPSGSPIVGGAGRRTNEFMPDEYTIPGTLGEGQIQADYPDTNFYTVGRGELYVVGLQAEMLLPTVTVGNAQNPAQVGQGMVAFLYVIGKVVGARTAAADPLQPSPISVCSVSVNSGSHDPDTWYSVSGAGTPVMAVADTEIWLATVANDLNWQQWYIPGAKVRNVKWQVIEY